MELLDRIILHCTATEPDHDVDVATIRRWHVDGNGWSDIGYHFLIRLDGSIEQGRPVFRQGAHTKGHNKGSIGIAYAGGVKNGEPHDTLTNCQYRSLQDLIFSLRMIFGFMPVSGHNEYANKACPSFKVSDKFPHINTTPSWKS